MKNTPLTDDDKLILVSLKEMNCSEDRMFFCNFSMFDHPFGSGEGWKKKLSAKMKELRERGLVAYANGLMTDEGLPAGSGYCITFKGMELLKQSQ